MDFDSIVVVPAIMVLSYFVGFCVKQVDKIDNKLIPVIVGITGIILGVIGYYTHAFSAPTLLDALAVGCVSGGGATWVNQIIKQFNDN